MGKLNDSVLDGFSGRVGPLVGASWRGVPYMRFYPRTIRDAKTPEQLAQRTKFSVASRFVSRILPYVRVGYRDDVARPTAYNRAVAYLTKYGLTEQGDGWVLNYANVLVSQGLLTGAADAVVTWDAGVAHFAWIDNSGVGNARPTDVVMPMVLNVALGVAAYEVDGERRNVGAMDLKVPAHWVSDDCVAYLGMRSRAGDVVADSVFLTFG